jgi:hypothetical protein
LKTNVCFEEDYKGDQPNKIKNKPKIVLRTKEEEKENEMIKEEEIGKQFIPKKLLDIKISQKMMLTSLMRSSDREELLDRANKVLGSEYWNDELGEISLENIKLNKHSEDKNLKKENPLSFEKMKKKLSEETSMESPKLTRIESPKLHPILEDLKEKKNSNTEKKERRTSIIDQLKYIQKEKIGEKEKISELKNIFKDNEIKYVKKMLEEKKKMNFMTIYSNSTTKASTTNQSVDAESYDDKDDSITRESEGIYSLISPRQSRNQYRNFKLTPINDNVSPNKGSPINKGSGIKKGSKKMPHYNPKDFLNSLNCRVFIFLHYFYFYFVFLFIFIFVIIFLYFVYIYFVLIFLFFFLVYFFYLFFFFVRFLEYLWN